MGLLCVTCDLDEIDCYHAVHGLPPPRGDQAHTVYNRALARVAAFLEDLHVPGTLFVVGKDIDSSTQGGAILRGLMGRGCEMGNHTMRHRYDFTLLGSEARAEEIDGAAQVMERILGVRPVGFRAPGYNIHQGISDLLSQRGYAYDSSVFPCPLYYSARAAAIGIKTVQGRRSKSIVGDPRILGSPTGPYRIGRDGIWTRGKGLAELPITVSTPARLPLLGTFIALIGKTPAALLARNAAKLPFVNLELHGIDFVDADGDGLGYLKEYQPELRIPLVRRRAILIRFASILLGAGMEPTTLANAADRMLI